MAPSAVLCLAALFCIAAAPSSGQPILGGESSDCEGYVPIRVDCPSQPFVKSVVQGGLSEEEAAWLVTRQQHVVNSGAWADYLTSLGFTDSEQLPSQPPPRMGIALSGGGLRATLNGAGVVGGLTQEGGNSTAGVLQLMTYFAGISGGSWTTGSLFNDLKPIAEWAATLRLHENILFPGSNRVQQVSIAQRSVQCAKAKAAAMSGDPNTAELLGEVPEHPLSLADLYGRSLSIALLQNTTSPGRQFTTVGEGTTFSGLAASDTAVATGAAALPLILSGLINAQDPESWADALLPWEISPFWTGSYHSSIASFFATKYTGTQASDCAYSQNGTVEGQAVNNFDNLGWTMAGSGLYVGQGVDWQNVTQVRHLSRFSATAPNPFDFPVLNPFNATDGRLHITDAGLGSFGSTPVLPMLLPSRDVKVIFFVDSSSGGPGGYPDGSELFVIAEYAEGVMGYQYPSVPATSEEFLADGLNDKVTFFGCGEDAPTFVYIPNHFVTFPSNTSTFKFAYDDEELQGMLENGVAQVAANPRSPAAPKAIGCLIASEAGLSTPGECVDLLEEYCWTPPTEERSMDDPPTSQSARPDIPHSVCLAAVAATVISFLSLRYVE